MLLSFQPFYIDVIIDTLMITAFGYLNKEVKTNNNWTFN